MHPFAAPVCGCHTPPLCSLLVFGLWGLCACCASAEKIVNPIMKKVYQASGEGGAPAGGDEEDFGHEDL